MFSLGEKFMELWGQIPEIITFQDYVGMANAIDDAYTGREITERDETTLLQALEVVKKARRIVPGMEQFRSEPFLQRIPALYRYEGLTAEEQRQDLTLPTEVGHLPMDVLIFDQTSDLTVNHPVELGEQDDIIAQLSMLRKEGQPLGPAIDLPFTGIKEQLMLGEKLKPLVPVFPLPFTGVKKQLTLVDHQQNGILVLCSRPAAFEVLPGIVHKEFGR